MRASNSGISSARARRREKGAATGTGSRARESAACSGRTLPGCAIGAPEEGGRLGVPGHFAFRGVIRKRAAQLHGKIGEDATRRGNVALLDIRDGAAAAGDGGEEIEHVPAG